MRITILALHLNVGGIEKFISDLASVLVDNHQVEVVSFYKFDEKPFFEMDSRVKVTYITNLVPNREQFKDALRKFNVYKIFKEGIKAVRILRMKRTLQIKFLKEHQTDVIITTRKEQSVRVGQFCDADILKIATEHNHHNNSQNYINELVSYTKKMDKLVLLSQELAEFYQERFQYTDVEVHCIAPVVYQTERKSNLDNNRVLSVGRLSKEKGFDDLLKVAKKMPELEFDIVGDGPCLDELETIIKNEEINNVRMHLFKNQEELEELYLNSSLFLMTSHSESFGLVLLEAMSYGLLCIAFDDAKGACEIIDDGVDGYLIKHRNIDEMVKVITNYFANNRIALQEHCTKKSLEYSLSTFARKWNNLITSDESGGN